jgi:hypothetical protein
MATFNVTINGNPYSFETERIHYEDIVAMASVSAPTPPEERHLLWSNGPANRPNGRVMELEVITLTEGMVFDVSIFTPEIPEE